MRAPGLIEPIVYFKNRSGRLMLAAYTSQPTPEGYMRCEASTLPLARELERRLQQQESDDCEREGIRHLAYIEERAREVRSRMYALINSSETSERDKEYLRLYIALRDDEQAKKFEQRWLEQTSYLWALHHDSPKDRAADEERVDLDRITY